MRKRITLSCLTACIASLSPLSSSFGASDVKFPDKVCNVTHYGAEGHRLQIDLNTTAIQQAIDDCAQAGGGTVLIPRGNYLTNPLFLKSNVQLKLEKDATLVASTEIAAWRANEQTRMPKRKMAGCRLSALPMPATSPLPGKAPLTARGLSGGSAGGKIFARRVKKAEPIAHGWCISSNPVTC